MGNAVVEKSWRHLNFWQYETELTARTPRVECPEHGVLLAKVPWARPGRVHQVKSRR